TNFLIIKMKLAVIRSREYMVQFVLPQILSYIRFVNEVELFRKRGFYAQFLPHPALCTLKIGFVQPRVGAYRIGPLVRRVVFALSSLLKQHFTPVVKKENRESAVQYTILVGFHLFHCAQNFVLF